MKLLLLRHAEAEPRAASDAQRELTARGRAQVVQTAEWLRGQGWSNLRIVASPYQRAQQTAIIMQEGLGGHLETLDGLTPEQDVRALCRWLAKQESEQLLLVSHMPLLGVLSTWLEQGVLESSPFALAEVRLLDLALVGAAQAQIVGRYHP